MKYIKCQNNNSGSALVYILIAIALLAALTASFMKPASQQTTSQNTFNTITELNSQINFIRSAIQECVLTYPSGDSGLIGTPNTPYPINPSSPYFNAAPRGGAAPNNQARYIACPGNPGNSNDHSLIFGGSSGKFFPPAVNLFEEWEYYNGADGVFFITGTNKTDAFLQTALAKLDNQYSECEVDIMSFPTPSTVQIASDEPALTYNGQYLLRVWLITKPSAIYPGDTDGEETAAGCP